MPTHADGSMRRIVPARVLLEIDHCARITDEEHRQRAVEVAEQKRKTTTGGG
jgi:hypothetical protein